MDEFNYTLIVSQYRYSRHSFLVRHNADTFIESAKKFTEELEKYKRSDDCTKDIDYGDLAYKPTEKISSRYNVNDWGDIYFISAKFANKLIYDAIDYYECSRRECAGYKKKIVIEDVAEHHSYDKVKEILIKHFEIV